MFSKILFFGILYVTFNIEFAQSIISDSSEETQTLAEMEKCINDVFNSTSVDKDKVCKSKCEKPFMEYLLRAAKVKSRRVRLHENKKYKELLCAAVSDERVSKVVLDQNCINITAAEKCKTPISKKLSSKLMFFNRHHDVKQTKSSCVNSKILNKCLLQSALVECPNTTVEYFKTIMTKSNQKCNETSLNAAHSHEASGLNVTIYIFTVLLTWLVVAD